MAVELDADAVRHAKVKMIFHKFDHNKDGGLDRSEMAGLVIAVNPKVKFKDEQIEAILDEVFKTYGEYITEGIGLSFEGLQQTYDDGAGDVDRDFEALNLVLDIPTPAPLPAIPAVPEPPAEAPSEPEPPAPMEEDKGGFHYLSTKHMVEALESLIAQQPRAQDNPNNVLSSPAFTRAVADLRTQSESLLPVAAVVEANMAMGRALMKVGRTEEAKPSFVRVVEIEQQNVRAYFLLGNAHYSMGQLAQAREAYSQSLEAGKADPEAHATILPQVHVNLGIAMEAEGLLMNACDHYREAGMLNPHHHHAMKLLGSALYGLGEYREAEEALQNALYLDPKYADAHCDLGSTLHALGDDVRAGQAFERALSLAPDHVDALYNYAGLLRDTGQFDAAVDTYSKVLELSPGHWQAQLNRAVSLLGGGKGEAAQRELETAYKLTNRVELYDAVKQLKRLYKENKKMSSALAKLPDRGGEGVEGGAVDGSFVVLDPARMKGSGPTVCNPTELAVALDVRAYQRHTRLSKVPVTALRAELSETNFETAPRERMVRKAAIELLLRQLLPEALPPETFQQAVRALNEKVISAVETGGGAAAAAVDLGLFLAIVALLCDGAVPERKLVAFEALQWRRGRPEGTRGKIMRRDAVGFVQLVREIYLPGQPPMPDEEKSGEEGVPDVGLEQFETLVDDYFPILYTLRKLEVYDRTRHLGMSCDVCRYAIVGLRYRETKSRFDVCATCYSERKAPAKHAGGGSSFIGGSSRNRVLTFAEYVTGTDKVREKFGLYGRTLAKTPTTRGGATAGGGGAAAAAPESGGGQAETVADEEA
ncbi:hypothetical protein CLOM_g9334 [Closterium sp. NIES-68]|nr:hypothetical protein CLOM_g9334 [Closterium sp. NIES-68]GJP69280.1 hypothetical protein CLOP_g222 [Closterium sp. NIES-67]